MLQNAQKTRFQADTGLGVPKLIFTHVPKTGGTSLVNALKQRCFVLHQDKKHPVEDFEDYEIIFGHFRPDKYDNDIPKAIFLRNPVERMLSHYCHWRARLEDEGKNMIMCFPEKTSKFSKDCSLLEFAERVGNIYKKYTDYNLDQYDFVGFTEFFDIYANKLSSLFNLGLQPPFEIKRANLFKRRLSQKECDKLSSLINEDLRFYYEAFASRA